MSEYIHYLNIASPCELIALYRMGAYIPHERMSDLWQALAVEADIEAVKVRTIRAELSTADAKAIAAEFVGKGAA